MNKRDASPTASPAAKPVYATDAKVRKAGKQARELGITPGGLELKPDGGIVIYDRDALQGVGAREVDRWVVDMDDD